MAIPEHQVRLLIADTHPTVQLFTEDDLTEFLSIEDGNVKRAAALALDAIGTSEALIGKVIRTQDAQTDGAKLSAELRARAAAFRAQADAADAAADGGFFDVVVPSDRRVELVERRWWT